MACCEIVKVNLTIIIQRIMHAFDCAFHKSNVWGSHSNANVYGTHLNANAFTISQRYLNAHSIVQHSNAFVNKPGRLYSKCTKCTVCLGDLNAIKRVGVFWEKKAVAAEMSVMVQEMWC